MTGPEITVLGLAGLLLAAQHVLLSVRANLELGPGPLIGPRDEDPRPMLSVRSGRIARALDNHVDSLVLYTAAVVLVVLNGKGSALTAGCAWIYLAARVVYVPAYVSGIPGLRSAVWGVGWLACVAMLLAGLT